MHEMAVVDNVLEIVTAQAQEHGLKEIKRIKIVIGDLAGIVPDVFSFCWEVSTESTRYAGAVLEIETKPALAVCNKCAKEYVISESLACPYCAGGIKEIISGKELYVDFIEGD